MKNNQKMKVHFIQHETFEAPAAYLEWAKQRNHTITFSKVYENQALQGQGERLRGTAQYVPVQAY